MVGMTSSGSRMAARGDEADAVREVIGEVGGNLEGEAGLADAPGTGQGQETDVHRAAEARGQPPPPARVRQVV